MREMKDSGIEWIGKIPLKWDIYPVRYAFEENKEKNSKGEITRALKFFNGSIIRKTNFDAEEDDYVSETIANYTVVLPDDIMINGLNLNYDLKSLRVGLVSEVGVITSAYLAIRPNKCVINARFATYLFKGYEAVMAFHNMGVGIRKTLGFKEFKKQPILLPNMGEQERIAGYLDAKCSKIDDIIAKQEKIIEKLKEYKLSVISEAVTKGLTPDTDMKDSGIEWIGDIPRTWSVGKIGAIFDFI